MKRILSLIMAITMVLSLLPSIAFAADATEPPASEGRTSASLPSGGGGGGGIPGGYGGGGYGGGESLDPPTVMVLSEITVSSDSDSLNIGGTAILKTIGTYSASSGTENRWEETREITSGVTYISGNISVATVSGNTVTAVAVGEAKITATYEGKTGEMTITVVDSGTCGDNLTWTINDSGTLTISGTGAMDDYTFDSRAPWSASSIKSVVIESGVTSIGSDAFSDCTSLTSITIPSTVTRIGDSAFSDCTSLLSATIPSSVTSIGSWAFSNCTSLSSVTIPSGVTSIGFYAFYNCTSLTSITIPSSVTSIGSDAFYWCTSLSSILVDDGNANYSSENGVLFNKAKTTLIQYPGGKADKTYAIPSGVTSIGGDAFRGCTSLTSITIPSSVTSIGNDAFRNCESLTSITIPSSVTSIGSYAFRWCTSLTSITIPSTVTRIGDSAFSDCTSLSSATIPSSVTSIGNNAFSGCSNLKISCIAGSYAETYAKDNSIAYESVASNVIVESGTCGNNLTWTLDASGTLTISGTGAMKNYTSSRAPWYSSRSSIKSVAIESGVTSIGFYAFYQCTSLSSVTIPSSVTSIGDCAFSYCGSLVSVTIPSSVTSIGDYAFSNCTSLTSVTIPSGVTSIGINAFYSCTSLSSVTIPSSVTSIGKYVFDGCTSLSSILVDDSSVNYSSENGVLFNKAKTTLIRYPEGKVDETYAIPSSVTSIEDGAFSDCASLTSITIPSSVTSIGNSAFSYCTSLTSITIPSGVTSIGINAFYYCRSLTSITIPSGVTSIGSYAFSSCTSLTSITIPSGVTSIGNYAFWNCTSLSSVTIPSSVTSVGSDAFFGCTSLISILVDDGNANYSSENGVLFNKAKTTLVRYPGGKVDETYAIPSSVTSIGDYAFSNCTSLSNVTIPSSVTSIGDSAFYYCTSLTSVTIPSSVTSIRDYAFYYCTSLTSITIPSSVTSIGDYAFRGCKNLTIHGCEGSYAESYAKNNSIKFEIVQIPVTGITLDKKTVSLYTGEKVTLVATIAPNDATNKNIFWSSTNVASVSVNEGTLTANAPGTAIITARTEDGNKIATCMVTVTNPIAATSLTLDKKEAYLIPGEKISLTATVMPSDATYKNVLWESSDKNVATVSDDGTVTAQGAGNATITARSEKNEASATCAITVKASYIAESILLDKSSLDIEKGSSEKLNVSFNPEYTTDKSLIWMSMDEAIATVDENGVVNAIGEGSTIIIVMSNSGNHSVSCSVTVFAPITGDIGGDGVVDINDAVAIFKYSMLPDMYPIDYAGSLDFTKDGVVDIKDAIRLFQYGMLPDIYPID